MSAQSLSYVWDIECAEPEEKLALLWIANQIGDLSYPCCPEWIGLSSFMTCRYERAAEVVAQLIAKGILIHDQPEGGGWSRVWIAYGGPYDDPFDWASEPRTRTKRVAALIERDGPDCSYCSCTPISYEVDHFIPRAKGGLDGMENLVLACQPCNRAKRDKMPEDFLRDRPELFHILSTNLKYLHEGL